MVRSQKPSIKKVEVVKEIDPEKLAFLMYLGQFDDEESITAQKWVNWYENTIH